MRSKCLISSIKPKNLTAVSLISLNEAVLNVSFILTRAGRILTVVKLQGLYREWYCIDTNLFIKLIML